MNQVNEEKNLGDAVVDRKTEQGLNSTSNGTEEAEPPEIISLNPATAARHPLSDKRIGDVQYRRINPAIADDYAQLEHSRPDDADRASAVLLRLGLRNSDVNVDYLRGHFARVRQLTLAGPESEQVHPAAIAIRNEVYDAAFSELCDFEILDDPSKALRLATLIADRTLQYITTKTVELAIKPNVDE